MVTVRISKVFLCLLSVVLFASSTKAKSSGESYVADKVYEILNAIALNNSEGLTVTYPSAQLMPVRILGTDPKNTIAGEDVHQRVRQATSEITQELALFIGGLKSGGPKEACAGVVRFMEAYSGGGTSIKPAGKERPWDISEFKRLSANRTFGRNQSEEQFFSEFRMVHFVEKVEGIDLDFVFEAVMSADQKPISTEGSAGWYYNYESAMNPSCDREMRDPLGTSFGPLYEDEDIRALKKCFYIEQLDAAKGSLQAAQSILGDLWSESGGDYLYCNLNVYRRSTVDKSTRLFVSNLYNVDRPEADCADEKNRHLPQEKINRSGAATNIYVVTETEKYYVIFNKGLQLYATGFPPTYNMRKMVETHYEEQAKFIEGVAEELTEIHKEEFPNSDQKVVLKGCQDFS